MNRSEIAGMLNDLPDDMVDAAVQHIAPKQPSADGALPEAAALQSAPEEPHGAPHSILTTVLAAAAAIAVAAGLGTVIYRLNSSRPKISVQASQYETEPLTSQTAESTAGQNSTERTVTVSGTGNAVQTENTRQTTEAPAQSSDSTQQPAQSTAPTDVTPAPATDTGKNTSDTTRQTTAASTETTAEQIPEEADPEKLIEQLMQGIPPKTFWDDGARLGNGYCEVSYHAYGAAFLCRDEVLPKLSRIGNFRVFRSEGIWLQWPAPMETLTWETAGKFLLYDDALGSDRSFNRKEYWSLAEVYDGRQQAIKDGILNRDDTPCIVQPMSGFLKRFGDPDAYTEDLCSYNPASVERIRKNRYALVNDFRAYETPGWTLCMVSAKENYIYNYCYPSPDISDIIRALKENTDTVLLGVVFGESQDYVPLNLETQYIIRVLAEKGTALNPADFAEYGTLIETPALFPDTYELMLSEETVSGRKYTLTESGEKDYTDTYRTLCREIEQKPGVYLVTFPGRVL